MIGYSYLLIDIDIYYDIYDMVIYDNMIYMIYILYEDYVYDYMMLMTIIMIYMIFIGYELINFSLATECGSSCLIWSYN